MGSSSIHSPYQFTGQFTQAESPVTSCILRGVYSKSYGWSRASSLTASADGK